MSRSTKLYICDIAQNCRLRFHVVSITLQRYQANSVTINYYFKLFSQFLLQNKRDGNN